MKILLKYRSALISVLLVFPFVLFAQVTGNSPAPAGNSLNPLGSVDNLWQLLINIFAALLEIALPVAVLMLVYSGYLFVTAMGSESQVRNAQENLKNTLIGIAVLLGARALVDLVRQTIEGISN